MIGLKWMSGIIWHLWLIGIYSDTVFLKKTIRYASSNVFYINAFDIPLMISTSSLLVRFLRRLF
jgi:hypothetical protein